MSFEVGTIIKNYSVQPHTRQKREKCSEDYQIKCQAPLPGIKGRHVG